MCQPCRRRSAALVQDNLEKHCNERIRKSRDTSLRSVTLTLKHDDQPLRKQIRRLFKCFSVLRRRKAVKDLFIGGTFVLEVKVSNRDGRWHPHLHIITEGRYVNVWDLSAAWEAVTKNSFRVYVKRIDKIAEAVGHDTKYITKATDDSVFQDRRKLAQYVDAIRGVRAYGTFGSWRGVKLTERRPDTGVWLSVRPLHQALMDADAGDTHWRCVIEYLRGHKNDAPHVDNKSSA